MWSTHVGHALLAAVVTWSSFAVAYVATQEWLEWRRNRRFRSLAATAAALAADPCEPVWCELVVRVCSEDDAPRLPLVFADALCDDGTAALLPSLRNDVVLGLQLAKAHALGYTLELLDTAQRSVPFSVQPLDRALPSSGVRVCGFLPSVGTQRSAALLLDNYVSVDLMTGDQPLAVLRAPFPCRIRRIVFAPAAEPAQAAQAAAAAEPSAAA